MGGRLTVVEGGLEEGDADEGGHCQAGEGVESGPVRLRLEKGVSTVRSVSVGLVLTWCG